MTNNVLKIKGKYVDGEDRSLEMALLEGDNDKAFSILKNQFLSHILSIYDSVKADHAYAAYNYKNSFYVESFSYTKNIFEKYLEKLGNKYTFDFSKYDSFQKITDMISTTSESNRGLEVGCKIVILKTETVDVIERIIDESGITFFVTRNSGKFTRDEIEEYNTFWGR
jgi:hypothetical protein